MNDSIRSRRASVPAGRASSSYTGPRSQRGKRRSSLNRLTGGLCSPELTAELRARGEDPKAFCALHRDLISWLVPDDFQSRNLIAALAEALWKKRRRVNAGVGAARPDSSEADAHIEKVLQQIAWAVARRHRKWRARWAATLGARPYGPTHMRLILEARLPALGGSRSAAVDLYSLFLARNGPGRAEGPKAAENASH